MTNSAIEEIRKNPEKKYDCDLYLWYNNFKNDWKKPTQVALEKGTIKQKKKFITTTSKTWNYKSQKSKVLRKKHAYLVTFRHLTVDKTTMLKYF
jgi:hypothetical protein